MKSRIRQKRMSNIKLKGIKMHVVCGHPRTGTSMMMEMLIASRYLPVVSANREKVLQSAGDEDFSANETFYEPSQQQLIDAKDGVADGNLIKIMYGDFEFMPEDYKLILMTRDPEEIRQSFDASFSEYAYGHDFLYKDSKLFKELYDNITNEAIEKYNPIILNYNEVINNPRKELSKITWTFDIEKAISIVEVDKYHFQLDKLVVGL